MNERQNLHGTGLVLGKTGLMLRGPSGAGKSMLALTLLDAWEALRLPARLVSDDRLDVEVGRSGLVMHAPQAIEGLIELRGRGIVRRPFVARAPLHLIVDFVDKLDRLVEEEALETDLLGTRLARCPVPYFGASQLGHQVLLVREAISALPQARRATVRRKTT